MQVRVDRFALSLDLKALQSGTGGVTHLNGLVRIIGIARTREYIGLHVDYTIVPIGQQSLGECGGVASSIVMSAMRKEREGMKIPFCDGSLQKCKLPLLPM